jgi:uncharacterized protein YybS (DUF2232 family)
LNHNVRKITDGAMMIAINGALLLLDRALGNVLTYYFMFLLPLPMVFYAAKYGMKDSWTVFAAMVLLAFVITTPQTVFYVASEALLGLVYGGGVYRQAPVRRLVIWAMLVGVVVNVVDTVVISALLGYDMPTQIAEMTTLMESTMADAGASLPSQINLSQTIAEIIIVSAILTGILDGYITHVLSRVLLKRLGMKVEPPQPLLAFYPPKWTGYLGLAGFVAYYYVTLRPLTSTFWQYALQGFGMIGYMYLLFFGVVALSALLGRGASKRAQIWFVLLAILLAMMLAMMVMILGFLYIATNDLHDRILNAQGGGNAAKDQ